MICPRWVNTPAQPIAVDDVVSYLAAAVDLAGDEDQTFDIGGPEVVSYGEMMRLYARLRGLRRLLISVPVLTPRLSGLWLGLVAPAHARVGRPLVEGLKNATVVRDPRARAAFAIDPMPLRQAFDHAIADGAAAWSKIDDREVDVDVSPARAFAPIRRIGGANGWYAGDLLWRVRGWLDRLTGGPGMRRRRLTVRTASSATSSTTGRSRPTSAIGGFASPPISASLAAAGSSSRSRRSTADDDPASVRSPRSTRVACSGGSIGMPSIRSMPSSSAGCCASWRAAPRPPSRMRDGALERDQGTRRHEGVTALAPPHCRVGRSEPTRHPARLYCCPLHSHVRARRSARPGPPWSTRVPFHDSSWPPWRSCWISSARRLRSSSSSPSWPGRGRSPSAAICCGPGRPAT